MKTNTIKQIDYLFSIINNYEEPCLASLSRQTIETDFTINLGKDINLREHLARISGEFSNLNLLTFYHAALIVAIRRNLNLASNLEKFETLWNTHDDILLDQLSLRWLISACDTISDHGDDSEKTLATAISFSVNTMKLYETERSIYKSTKYHSKKIGKVTDLFNGMTTFKVGSGDMVKNLLKRVEAINPEGRIEKIFKESVKRIKVNDTVYSRLSAIQEKNSWQ